MVHNRVAYHYSSFIVHELTYIYIYINTYTNISLVPFPFFIATTEVPLPRISQTYMASFSFYRIISIQIFFVLFSFILLISM